jgi:hypothetical protein
MYGRRTNNVIRLQDYPESPGSAGVAAGIRSRLYNGRQELVTVGPNNLEFGFIGNDPYNTNVHTGLVVPPTPSADIDDARYLFLLARESFGTGEQSSDNCGVRLVGIRQYAELIARVPNTDPPTPPRGVGGPSGVAIFRKEITNPLWHPPDGNISWHVMILNKGQRDTRNPANGDGFMYQDALSPALLYQVDAPYVPPNGGRPWGVPLGASLGNIHDLRYRWRSDVSEYSLDIPIPVPCDVALFASVRQNNPETNTTLGPDTDCAVFTALSEEDRFLVAFDNFAQYGSIAGALVFDQDLGRDVP